MNKWQAGNRIRQVIVLRNDVSLQAGPHICHPLAWEEPVPKTDKFPNMTNFLSDYLFACFSPHADGKWGISEGSDLRKPCWSEAHVPWASPLEQKWILPPAQGLTIVPAALELQGVDLTSLVTCGVCANSKAGLTIKIKILWFAYFVLINWTFASLFLQHRHIRSVLVSSCHSFPSFILQNSSFMNYQ